jgi:hypothetical protein
VLGEAPTKREREVEEKCQEKVASLKGGEEERFQLIINRERAKNNTI